MSESPLGDIIWLCLVAHQLATEVYENLKRNTKNPEHAKFWDEMVEREQESRELWEQVVSLVGAGPLPPLFANPMETKNDLTAIRDEILTIERESQHIEDSHEAFLLALNLELHLLHPAFETICQYFSTAAGIENRESNYELRLNRYVEAFKSFDDDKPELKLLGGAIRQLWQQNRQLAIQSKTDLLTGIYNRRGLFNTIEMLAHIAQRNSTAIGILMIDIDRFKEINDTHGHQKGDEIICWTANIIKQRIRSSDVVGRYGGEEFLVFLSPVEPAALEKIAEEIREKIETGSKTDTPVTISVGVAHGTLESGIRNRLHALIRTADRRLYMAKQNGRNQVVCSEKPVK